MTLVSLESLVPSDHIVRLMEKHIDFSFIDKRTEGLYICLCSKLPQALNNLLERLACYFEVWKWRTYDQGKSTKVRITLFA